MAGLAGVSTAIALAIAVAAATGRPPVPPSSVTRAFRAPAHTLYFTPVHVNKVSGPTGTALANALAAPPTATFVVTYDSSFSSHPGAQAAFQTAVDIWARVVASPVPIRVRAGFTPMPELALATGGPTAVCTISNGTRSAPAALADSLTATQSCASQSGETHEIAVTFSDTYTNWDFGANGIGVVGSANFLTAALHELAHGLGVWSSMTSDGTMASFTSPVGVFDYFVTAAGGRCVTCFGSPSSELHTYLTAYTSMTFRGEYAEAVLETRNFSTDFFFPNYGVAGAQNGWLQGSSYVHLPSEGLMAWALGGNQVHTEASPILRGILKDIGWTIRPAGGSASCTYSLNAAAGTVPAESNFSAGSVTLTTQPSCPWVAFSNTPEWLRVIPIDNKNGASGTGTRSVGFRVSTNLAFTSRTGTLTVGGQTFQVTQAAGDGCDFHSSTFTPLGVYLSAAATAFSVYVRALPSCSWSAVSDTPSMLTITAGSSGTGDAVLDFDISANPSAEDRQGTITVHGRTLTVTQRGLATIVPGDIDGDGRADLVTWTPASGTWSWLTSSSDYTSEHSVQWGNAGLGDSPFLGDLDGDGRGDLVIWRASTGTWYWLSSSTGYSYDSASAVQWGNRALGDQPMLADMDGDAAADLVVWRASTGTWYWLTSSSSYDYSGAAGVQWGNASYGDQPLLGDLDGDGRGDLVVWRATSGTWFWLTSSTSYEYASAGIKQWGSAGSGCCSEGRDIAMLGDIDGDAKADLVAYRGYWLVLTSSSGYDYPQARGIGGAVGQQAFMSDFDGDGIADLVTWTRANACCQDGTWNWLTSSSGYVTQHMRAFGNNTDIK
jgi:hypothetical protein